jgi:hypothetical protein
MSQLEHMVQMFAAIDDDGRSLIIDMLEGEYERVQKERRPTLRLIPGGSQPSTEPRSTRTVVRIKNAGER